jgi:hypothetical protein
MPEYIDSASPYATVSALAAQTTTIFTHELKNGKRPFLLSFRNAVGAGGETYVSFSLLLNGNPLENFDRIQNQIAAPENQQGQLVIRKELPQGSVLKVVAINSDPVNAYNATAKVELAYESF